jgi:hypothetical protein
MQLGQHKPKLSAGIFYNQFLPSKPVKKGECSPVQCTVYTDFGFQKAL